MSILSLGRRSMGGAPAAPNALEMGERAGEFGPDDYYGIRFEKVEALARYALGVIAACALTSCRWGIQVLTFDDDSVAGTGGNSLGGEPNTGGASVSSTGGDGGGGGGGSESGGAGGDSGCTESTWYEDQDGDGFGNPDVSESACTEPAGYVAEGTDCADDPTSDPACNDLSGDQCAPDLEGNDDCDGADNDCDGLTDEDCVFDLPVTSGLILWLDGSDDSTFSATGGVAQWDDKSGLSHHALQADIARQPTAAAGALGGRSALRFDGVDDSLALTNAGAFDGAAITMLLVVVPRWVVDQPSGNPSVFAIRGEGSGLTRISVHVDGSYMNFHTFNGNFNSFTTHAVTQDAAHYLDFQRVSGDFSHYVNGVWINTATQPLGADLLQPVRIGAAQLDLEHFMGDIAEVVVFGRSLTAQERSDLNAYIETKWGIDTSP